MAITVLTACPAAQIGPSRDSPALYTKAPASGFTGQAPSIDLLVRGFLVRGTEPRQDFAYYAYLLFLDRGDASRAEREAAAFAFLEMLEDVEDVQAVRGFTPAQTAILYAPAKKLPPDHTVASFMREYDYSTAQLIARRIERSGGTVPAIALVGAPTPLEAGATSIGVELRIHDLTGDPAAAQAGLRRFHESLVHPGRSATISQVLQKARAFFDSVGAFLLIMKDPLPGGPSPAPP